MDNFGPDVYVPTLWTRRGERTALASLPAAVRSAIRPLFVVAPIEFDFDTEAPKKTLSEHMASLPKDLVACWGIGDVFADLSYFDDAPMPSGQHPLDWLSEECAALGMTVSPVVSHSSTPAYRAAAGAAAARSDAGVCLRLTIPEWPSATGTSAIDDLLDDLGCAPEDAHLILDLEEDVGATARIAAASEIRTLPYLDDWRSLVVTGTAIPETMPQGSGLHVLPRSEWATYLSLRSLVNPLPRLPTFGDYAVASTSPGADVNPRFMNISATLRYTATQDWLVGKGGLWKGNGGKSLGAAAVPPAAALIAGHADFLGSDHCDFDEWLVSVAAGTGGSNPEAWRRYGTQHHLQFVTEQIASLP
ncbi:beta family protein [Nocardioides sp. cx-173]|nr:beta family protein [Nocardioides sp. cx-173]MCD4525244.1 beta family protein [Nocardioides sp. cx-173]UGB40953.1 beta family protein [Nocardioides sp. cx-173]